MTRRSLRNRTTASILLAGVVAVWAATMVLANTRPGGVDQFGLLEFFWGSALALPFPIVGFVIVRRDPTHPLGWIFLVAPLLAIGGIGPWEVVARLEADAPAIVGFVADAMFYLGISLMASFFLVLFPTGRLPSRRWRWMTSGAVAGIGLLVIWALGRDCITWSSLDLPDEFVGPSCADPMPAGFIRFGNPFGTEALGASDLFDVAGALGSALVILAFFAGVVSLFIRYRSAGSLERAQLRWPLVLFSVLAPLFFVLIAIDVADRDATAFAQTLFFAATIGLPVAIGFAITRYRLYDIDRIISRSVTYVVVVAISAGAFALLALVPTLLLGGTDGGDPPAWLVAMSTLAIATGFSPVRRRVQRVVDRRFDRARYDAGRVAERFAERVRDETELGDITADLGGVAAEIFRPRSVGLWMRS